MRPGGPRALHSHLLVATHRHRRPPPRRLAQPHLAVRAAPPQPLLEHRLPHTYADGAKYVGQFQDGKMHGLGKATLADGEVGHDGEWENGEAKE